MRITSSYRFSVAATAIVFAVFMFTTCTQDKNVLKADNLDALRGSISGKVLDKNNNALSGVLVTAYPGGSTTLSGNDGGFTLEELLAGKHVLAFRFADYIDTTTDSLPLSLHESKRLDAPVHMKYRYAWIRGTITCGISGMIDAGVQIENQVVSTRTLPTGSFLLPHVLPGRCKVFGAIHGVGYGVVEKDIPADDTTDMTIAITNTGGTVQGQVTDATNNPVVGATVSAMGNVIADTTDLKGNYTLTEVPADGHMTLTISKGADTVLVGGVQVADSQSISLATVKMISAPAGILRIIPMSVQTIAGLTTSIAVSAASASDTIKIAWYDWDENGDGVFDRRTPVPVDTGLVFAAGSHIVKVRAVASDTTVVSETVDIGVTVVAATYALATTVNSALMGSISPKSGNFASGVKIKLIAMPASGYTFDHWGGIDSALILNDTLTMPAHNAAVKAVFKAVAVTYYTFIATTNNDTMGSVSPASGNYAVGALIKLTRTADSGYVFDHWGGADSVSVHNDTLTMPSHNAAVKAIFKSVAVTYYAFIATTNNDTMGSVSPTSGSYAANALVKLTRTANGGYTFDHWGGTDSGSIHNDTLTMPGHNAAVKAVFKAVAVTYYTFVATTNNDTMGSVSPTSGNYATGAKIKLTRTANGGDMFDHWGGADSISMHSDTLYMPGHNAAVKAVFKVASVTYTLSATVNNTLMGTVFPTSGNYASGTKVPLSRTANGGYMFDHWGGVDSVSMHSDTLYMPGHNAAVIGVFKANTYSLTETVNNAAMGSASDSGYYVSGAKIKLYASANTGYTFDHWGGADSASMHSDTLYMPAHNAAVMAVFRANIYTLTTTTNNDTMGSVSPTSGNYATGAKIKLTRTANGGYVFDHWGGADSASMHSDSLYMPGHNAVIIAVFKSMYQWTAVNSGLTNDSVWSLAVNGGNTFAGTGNGVYLSTNNGTSWTAVNSGLTNTDVRSLAVSGSNIFAGTQGYGVFLSSNNGTSWNTVDTGLTNRNILSLAVNGSNIFAGTSGGVFLSTNNGTSWTAVNSGLTNTYISALAVNGSNIFAGTSGGGVFLSTNNGTGWTPVNFGLDTTNNISSLAMIGSNIFAGTNGSGVFLSSNNGTSWTQVNSGLTNNNINSLSVSGGKIFAGTSGGGVFLSTDNGASWTAINSGLSNMTVISFANNGGTIFAGTYRGGAFRSPLP